MPRDVLGETLERTLLALGAVAGCDRLGLVLLGLLRRLRHGQAQAVEPLDDRVDEGVDRDGPLFGGDEVADEIVHAHEDPGLLDSDELADDEHLERTERSAAADLDGELLVFGNERQVAVGPGGLLDAGDGRQGRELERSVEGHEVGDGVDVDLDELATGGGVLVGQTVAGCLGGCPQTLNALLGVLLELRPLALGFLDCLSLLHLGEQQELVGQTDFGLLLSHY